MALGDFLRGGGGFMVDPLFGIGTSGESTINPWVQKTTGQIDDYFAPNRVDWQGQEYDPNAANFNLQMPGGTEAWQGKLAGVGDAGQARADQYGSQSTDQLQAAGNSDQAFQQLMAQGGQDYSRGAAGYDAAAGQFAQDRVRSEGLGRQMQSQWAMDQTRLDSQQRNNEAQFGQDYGRSQQNLGQLQSQFGQDYGRATQAYGQGQQAYAQGQQAVDLTRSAALGQQPSVAALQQKAGLEAAVAGQASAANSGPYNPAAGIVAGQRGQTMQQQAFNSGAQLRAQEMTQARGQFGQMVGQQQGAAQGLGSQAQGIGGMAQAYGGLQTQATQGLAAQGQAQEQLRQQGATSRAQLGQAQGGLQQSWAQGLGSLSTAQMGQQAQTAQGLAGMTGNQAGLQQSQGGQYRQTAGMLGGLESANRSNALNAYGQVGAIGGQQQQGLMGLEQLRGQQRTAANDAEAQRQRFNATQEDQQKQNTMAMGGQIAGGIMSMMSDERSKQELASAHDQIAVLRQRLADLSGPQPQQPSPAPAVQGSPFTGFDPSSAEEQKSKANLRYLVGMGQMSEKEADSTWTKLHYSPVKEGWRQWLESRVNQPESWRNPVPEQWQGLQTGLVAGTTPDARPGAPSVARFGTAPSGPSRLGDGLDRAPTQTGILRFGDGLDAPVSKDLSKVEPVSYHYKPEARAAFPASTAPGTRYGVTAQDLEQAGPVGQSMVKDGPGGLKEIDVGQASGAMLASMGEQQREIDGLKAELARMRGGY